MIKKIVGEWKITALVSFLIILAGLGLRLYHLDLLPIFVDEAIYVRWAQVMKAEPTLRFLPLSDGKQPFFMWATIPFFKIFTDPLLAGRALSVICGAASLIGVMVLSYLFFKSKKVSLLAGIIYALSPFVFFFDRLALVDAMLSMFGVWYLIFAVITAKKLRLDTALISGFILGGALLTKSPALFFVILTPAVWLLTKWSKKPEEIFYRLIKLLCLFGVTFLVGYGLYNILRLGPNFQMIAIRNKDYVYPLGHFLTSFKDPLIPFLKQAYQWIFVMGPWPLFILAAFGLIANFKKYWKETGLLAALFIVPIFIQAEFAKVFTARYILFSLPYLIVLAASGFLIKTELLKKTWLVIFVIFVFQAARFDYHLLTDPDKAALPRSERSGYLEEWTAGTGIREVAELLKIEEKKLSAGKQVVVGTEGYFGTLPDGLQIYVNNYPKITVIGVGVIIDKVHDSLIESKKFGNPTYLVVNNTRFKGDADKLGLKLLAAYPKAVRPDGSREALLLFEVRPTATYKAPKL